MSLADLVRRHDPDRYFTALFAPAARRESLFTLYAFNHELARALEVAREPAMALIRLQWWREVVEGAPRAHEVATPLATLLQSGALPAAPLLSMIAAREADAESPAATQQEWLARLRQGPGALAIAAASLLGTPTSRIANLGAAYGATGTWRNITAMARQDRCLVPADMLAAAGFTPHTAIADPVAAIAALRPSVAATVDVLLGPRQPMPRAVIAAALPAVLALRDVRREEPLAARGVADRLAVVWAARRRIV